MSRCSGSGSGDFCSGSFCGRRPRGCHQCWVPVQFHTTQQQSHPRPKLSHSVVPLWKPIVKLQKTQGRSKSGHTERKEKARKRLRLKLKQRTRKRMRNEKQKRTSVRDFSMGEQALPWNGCSLWRTSCCPAIRKNMLKTTETKLDH